MQEDEEEMVLRDGTFVYVYCTNKEWLQTQLHKHNNDSAYLKLNLSCVMNVSLYFNTKKQTANEAISDFVRYNVK